MFTGIVQEIGIISNKEETESGIRLEVKVSKTYLNKLAVSYTHLTLPTSDLV